MTQTSISYRRGAGVLSLLLGFFWLALTVALVPAHAWTPFGTEEDIHPIEDVTLTGPDGQPLFLGYKTSTVYFIGGMSVSDDGYVLGLRADPARFLDLPTGETLAGFQTQGLMPDPLPSYSLGIFDYLRGYSLWIALVVLAAGYGLFLTSRRDAGRARR